MLLVRAFSVSKDPDGEVFDVRGPLSRQLEKLHIVPLDAVNQHCRGAKQISLFVYMTGLGGVVLMDPAIKMKSKCAVRAAASSSY